MSQRFLRYKQAQLSQIMIFGKTFSKSKFLFWILSLNRKLLQGNSFRRTRHATLSAFKTCLMIHSIRVTTRSTLSSRFFWLAKVVCALVILVFPLVALVFSLALLVFPLVVLVCPTLVSVCPLVVLTTDPF